MQTINQRRAVSALRDLASLRAEEQVRATAKTLAGCIVESINTGESYSVKNPSNWPSSAAFGVSYSLFDRQFPSVEQGETVVYFDDVSQLIQWLEEKRDWIRGTDYDFSMDYSVYTWDWGPVFKYSKSI